MSDFEKLDTLLQSALMDANLQQYAAVLDDAQALRLSSRYLRQRTGLLADPRRWMCRRSRPLWVRSVRAAACFLLVCSIAFGSLLAVSPTARAAVVKWFRTVFTGDTAIIQGSDTPFPDVKKTTLKDSDGNEIGSVTQAGDAAIVESELSMEELEEQGALSPAKPEESVTPETGSDTVSAAQAPMVTIGSDGTAYVNADAIQASSSPMVYRSAPQYAPTWLPETVRLEKVKGNHGCDDTRAVSEWRYRDGIGWLTLTANQSKKFTHIVEGLTEENHETVTVNGQAADYYRNNEVQRLYWDGGDASLMLEHDSYSYMSKETMIRIAESVKKLTVPAVYSIKWMPEGSHVMEWDDAPGGGWKKYADGNHFYFTFLYANSKGGAHMTCGIDPEAVTVNGCGGTYYAPVGALDGTWSRSRIFYDEETGSEVTAIYYEPSHAAAITWTNTEGVTFTICGAFEKDVLLKMAESVAAD